MTRRNLWDRLTLGSARRSRHMQRQLRELDRWYAAQAAGPRRPRERARRLLVTLATAGVCVPASLAMLHQQGLYVDLHGVSRRVGIGPASAAEGSGPYRFMERQPHRSEPVTYDPCLPIHLVTNDRLAPRGSAAVLSSALGEVSNATGLTFVRDGRTDELPRSGRPISDPARYGQGWSPVLLAWTTPEQDPGLVGPVAGLGGSTTLPEELTGRLRYVTGTVALDAPAMRRIMSSPGRGTLPARAILMHELAHVVGLAHVRDRGELMAAQSSRRTTFGPGDRRGLARLGRGRCTG